MPRVSCVGMLHRVGSAVGRRIGLQLATDPLTVSSWQTSDALSRITLDQLYGLVTPHLHVTRDLAMSIATVSKARRMIAGTVGRMQLTTTKGGLPVPLQPQLLFQPERDRTLSASLTWLVDGLMFHPQVWWIVQERTAPPSPGALGWPLWVKLLTPGPDATVVDGQLVKAWGKPVAAADVIQFDSVDGGALKDAAETIRRAVVINQVVALAEANPVPSIELHNEGDDIPKDKAMELVEMWVAARKSHGVGYSNKALKVNPLGIQPEQLLIDGRKQIQLELVRHFGLPAWAADVALEGASLTYQNRASRNWELIDLACAPYMTAIAQRLSLGDVTPRGWAVSFNTDALTTPDMKTRFETYRIGLGAAPNPDGTGGSTAFITQDQINQWEGWAAA